MAEGHIKKYSDDASFSNIEYNRDAEESLIKNVFRNSILLAGEVLTAPYRTTEKFLRLINSHPEFKPFLKNGLAEAIVEIERKTKNTVFEIPQTVSWERVSNRLPGIFYDLIEVVESEKRRFS